MDILELSKKLDTLPFIYDISSDEIDSFINNNIKDERKKHIYLKELHDLNINIKVDPYISEGESKIGLMKIVVKIKNFLKLNNKKIDGLEINIHPEILNHIDSLLESEHYFNAVEESYKFVRDRLRTITGKEKAHEAFKKENYEIIFGREAENQAEEDYFEGVKFLHMAIQKFRNEKAHNIKKDLDYNKALHYIIIASLALYQLKK